MTAGGDDDIRRKAYELWEKEGRPEGRHDEHWHRARETAQGPAAATSGEEPREDDMQASGSTPGDVSETRHTEPPMAVEAPQSPKQKSAAKKAPRKKP